jgi:UDP-N-acetylglucosamine 2-epimerase
MKQLKVEWMVNMLLILLIKSQGKKGEMMKKIKVMVVFGTRPEAIKMAPLVLELQKQSETIETITVVTAQHRQMLDQVLETFRIQPDYDLDIMGKNQSLLDITARILEKFDPVVKEVQPDMILVHGDTTTTFAASLVAFYNQVRIGHVEAGLRTFDKYSPFPEEMNRQMTDNLADLYFAPTSESKANLLMEHHPESSIFITGNTAIDALRLTVQEDYHHQVLDQLDPQKKLVLVTMHRRENQGQPMRAVFGALREMVDAHPELEVVYPVHLSPAVQEAAKDILGEHDRIHLIAPLDVFDFHNLASRSYFIMSDSGGVQEEAPSLGKPVLVLRDTTERPEGVKAGTLKLVGTDPERVKEEMTALLTDPDLYQKMSSARNPYGDGKASERIVQAIQHYYGLVDVVSEFIEGEN